MDKLNSLKLVLGSALLATLLYAILAAPGLLTDAASTAMAHQQRIATVRR